MVGKRTYQVTVPFAGHMVIEVDADTEAAAIEKALEEVTPEHIEGWEPLKCFHEGNVCYCPHPWEAEVVDYGPADGEPVRNQSSPHRARRDQFKIRRK